MRKTLMVASLALVAAACSTLGRQVFAEPQVSFRDVKINGLGLTGGSLDIVLAVYNPNEFRLDATKLTYRLLVGDSIQFGDGVLDSQFTVQEKDSTLVRLPLSFTYSGIGAAGRQLLQTGSVNYTVAGDVTVATPIGNFTRPYRGTGTFNTLSGSR
jgi:LEA14-like dessication related protein